MWLFIDVKLLHLLLLELRAYVCIPQGEGSRTASVMFVCVFSVVLLSVMFIIISVLEVGNGTDAMSYFNRG